MVGFLRQTSLAALYGVTQRESGSKIHWSQKDCSNNPKCEVIQVQMRAETTAGRGRKGCINEKRGRNFQLTRNKKAKQ